ncbi:hypothetical protein [Mycobacterium sp. NPDC006124]|uniref:hypothetical protein n=1 Tax=Mycobacterium sp. NPDC006124 TaxID=3156729 RepID=UPI0033BDADDA
MSAGTRARFGTVQTGHTQLGEPTGGNEPDGSNQEDVHMTMPSDAADAVETQGPNEGPRDHSDVDTDHAAYVDEDNVPHPGDANEAH